MKPWRWRHERARHHARRASEALIQRRYGVALVEFAVTFVASPRMARDRLLYAWLAEKAIRVFERLVVKKP